jgi:glycosyltransferase involved in cell wall biosynthesis
MASGAGKLMKLLIVADGHSPIAQSWIHSLIAAGHEVHLASTFYGPEQPGLASLSLIPVAGSNLRGGGPGRPLSPLQAATIGWRTALRRWVGPLTLGASAIRLSRLADELRPDLVHALRIPYEGMLAANAALPAPLIVSIWGNDLTLHASAAPPMAMATRRTLRRAAGLMADCRRDLRLASRWGWPAGRPGLVVPGNGGVDTSIFHAGARPAAAGSLAKILDAIPVDDPVVVNARGFRAYVRNDSFFAAIPLILEQHPSVHFLCVAMAGQAEAENWRARWPERLHLLPDLPPAEMAGLFARAAVSVSPSVHDGIPNTLLEAMACGCYPVAGDLESLREWIEPDVNGIMFDAADARDLARALCQALADQGRRRLAAHFNHDLITGWGTAGANIGRVEAFYRMVLV